MTAIRFESSSERVTQVSYHYLPIVGGQEVYVQQLNDLIKDMGFSSCVVQRPRKGFVETAETLGTPYIPFLGRLIGEWDRHLFTMFLLLSKRRLIPEDSLVIVHYALHSPVLWRQPKRAIILSHGKDWDESDASVEHRLREFLSRRSFLRFTLVANDTDYLRTFGINIEPGEHPFEEVAPDKWYIPNCVDTDEFGPAPNGRNSNTSETILVPRQITPDRGIELAIHAYALFVRTFPSVKLRIVGKVRSESYLKSCLRLVQELGLSSNVDFAEFVERKQMPEVYRSSALSLIPSLRREGTSLSALESMACGTAAVCTRVGGLVDLPAVLAQPNAVDVAEKLCSTYINRHDVAAKQSRLVRGTFNTANWREAWSRVIRSQSALISNIDREKRGSSDAKSEA